MLQFCRNTLKIEQNCRTLSLMFVQNSMQNLNKILVSKFDNHYRFSVGIVSSSILTPNTRNFKLMILHLC